MAGTDMLTKVMPELPSDDDAAAVAHHRDVLGSHLEDHPWGLRDFRVLDLDDNQLTFGEPLR